MGQGPTLGEKLAAQLQREKGEREKDRKEGSFVALAVPGWFSVLQRGLSNYKGPSTLMGAQEAVQAQLLCLSFADTTRLIET